MAMIKADAYGHGLIPVARQLESADGLAVARLREAFSLREADVRQRVLVLGTILDTDELMLCAERGIDVTVHDERSVASLMALPRSAHLSVWLKLDSGMHRLGLSPAAFINADKQLSRHMGNAELVHMTHLGCASDPMSPALKQQLACFWSCRRHTSNAKVSLANSAALIAKPETRMDWVRPGIMLYGDNPMAFATNYTIPVRPVMTLSSRMIAIRAIRAGESVGYNGTWTSSRPSLIGTVGIGYGDGYPRHARTGTPVWINGQTAPLVGVVSMDSLTVDLTECDRVAVGDEVVLWGPQIPASTVAEYCNTISYELFTSISSRVSREYSNPQEAGRAQ
jgi:alanine racemase